MMENYSELKKIIKNNITYFRNKNGLTQSELSEKVNISQSVISRYERGQKDCELEIVYKFCEFFDVSIYEFLFCDFENKNSMENFPIGKVLNKSYYVYYLEEDKKGKSLEINYFLLDVKEIKSLNEAKITFSKKDRTYSIEGEIRMDTIYSYVIINNLQEDFFLEITFYYYKNSHKYKKYFGGLGILQRLDCRKLPVVQLCIISESKIDDDKYSELKEKLRFNMYTNNALQDSDTISSFILKLTKEKGNQTGKWLKKIINK